MVNEKTVLRQLDALWALLAAWKVAGGDRREHGEADAAKGERVALHAGEIGVCEEFGCPFARSVTMVVIGPGLGRAGSARHACGRGCRGGVVRVRRRVRRHVLPPPVSSR